MPPKRSTAALTAASASCVLVTSSLTTSRSSASPSASRDGVGVAAGGDDVVAGGQRGLGEVDAHAAAGAGDEPGLRLGSHGSQQSADPRKVGVPVERGTGRVSQARTSRVYAWLRGDEDRRSASSSPPAAPGSRPSRPGCRPTAARRVPGLRREEVAVLAGVSVPYYTRLERGDMSGASESVLEALARALQLDDAERAHLFDLARAAQPTAARPRRRQAKQRIRPEIQWTLDAITGAAAYRGQRPPRHPGRQRSSDARCSPSCTPRPPGRPTTPGSSSSIRAPRRSTPTGTAPPARPPRSCARPQAATRTTATSQTSSASSRRRARRSAPTGPRTTSASTPPAVKHFHHPVVGELSLSFNRLDLAADHGLTLFTYAAEPGSRSEEALKLLGSWAATRRPR